MPYITDVNTQFLTKTTNVLHDCMFKAVCFHERKQALTAITNQQQSLRRERSQSSGMNIKKNRARKNCSARRGKQILEDEGAVGKSRGKVGWTKCGKVGSK